jgi:uncharacterized damage-inducible protein DinB
MSEIVHLLQAFDDTWSHECESMRSVLQNVTAEEAWWQHPVYAAEMVVEGLPKPGTICWHVAHLEHCARHYTDILRNRPVMQEPSTPPPGIADLNELIHRLEGARRLMRQEIQRLDDVDLDAACVRGMSVAEFLRMAIRHETWHAGQLVVIRRLYRQRPTD